MAKVRHVQIEGFRSICSADFEFPLDAPLVLVGENNAGKSNILAAIELVLGEFWPGNRMPVATDFWNRNEESIYIKIDFRTPLAKKYSALNWRYIPGASNPQEMIVFRPVFAESGDESNYSISNIDRDDCICVYVQAERNLDYVLSYKSKITMLSKLMHRFHNALKQDPEVMENLKKQFEDTKTYFNQIESFSSFQNTLRCEFADLIASMTYRLEIDFEAYNPANFFHALRVQAKEGESPRSFDELGTGEQQILALAFAKAYAKEFHANVLLAIEEPESHLHPLAQEWLAMKLRELAKADGIQVALTTHSPIFIDLLNLDGMVLVSKDKDGTNTTQATREKLAKFCQQHGAHPQKTRADNIFEFYAANTTKEILEGFFAKRIVLVEGPTESLAIPIYLRIAGFDCLRERISFIPVHGKGNLARYWRLFSYFGIPTYVIFDNDAKNDKGKNRRIDLLNTLKISEDYDVILGYTDLQVQKSFAVFGNDFETTLRYLFDETYCYGEIESEAHDFLGVGENDSHSDYKPLIARYVAQKIAIEIDDHVERCKQEDWDTLSYEASTFFDPASFPSTDAWVRRYILTMTDAHEGSNAAWEKIIALGDAIMHVSTETNEDFSNY